MIVTLTSLNIIGLIFSIFVLTGYAVDQYVIRAKDRQIHDLLMCYRSLCSNRSDKYRTLEIRFVCQNCINDKTIFINQSGYL